MTELICSGQGSPYVSEDSDEVNKMREFPGYYPVGKSVQMFNCRSTISPHMPPDYIGYVIQRAEMEIAKKLGERGLFIHTELKDAGGRVTELVLSLPVANFKDKKERRNYVNSMIKLQSLNDKLLEENKRYRTALKSVREYCTDTAKIVIDDALSRETV